LTHAHGKTDALSVFYRDAHALHQPLADQLQRETGIDVGWRPLGGLDLAFDEQEAQSLREWIDFNLSRGAEAQWLDAAALRQAEPDMSHAILGGALFPQDARVDPVLLGEAMLTASIARGTTLHTETHVTALVPGEGGVDCVLVHPAGERRAHFDVAVVTAGSWSAALHPAIHVRPIRGQSGRFSGISVRHVVRWGGQHALPAVDGALVGGTVEKVDFDLDTTAAAEQELSAWCAHIFKPATDLQEIRAGLRPKPRRGRPVIAPVDETGSAFVATGHYKNGILMAPLTGQVLSRWIMEGSPDRDMSPFTIQR
jgi:glycine oxidase